MAGCNVHEGDQKNGAAKASEEGTENMGYSEGMAEEGYDEEGHRLDDGTDEEYRLGGAGRGSEEE